MVRKKRVIKEKEKNIPKAFMLVEKLFKVLWTRLTFLFGNYLAVASRDLSHCDKHLAIVEFKSDSKRANKPPHTIEIRFASTDPRVDGRISFE